jgi:type IV pilus assembly protein PilP
MEARMTSLYRRFGLACGLLLFALALLIGSGCKKEKKTGQAPAPAPAAPAAAKPAAPTPTPSVEREERPIYSYNPIGKRDPFEVFALTDTVRPDVPLTPLQRFSIDQLKLVGIIWGISNPRAMVEDPGGKGHVLKRGTLIGRNWGKVSRIKQDEVIIAEEYRDIDGRLVVNEISLKLPKPKELEEEE